MLDRIYQALPNRRLIIIGLVFFHLSLAIVYFISDSITGAGFDESVIYFLHTGVDGLETSGYRYLFVSTVLLILLCLYVCLKLGRSRFLRHPENAIKVLRVNFILIALLFFQPVFKVLATQPLYDIATGKESTSIDLEIPGDIEIRHKKNIVYIYLESFERSFLDETQFPGLAPNIRELEKQGLAFTNIDTAFGARWTIAGMVASQCGLLLETDAPGANTPGAFMPGAVCLGDTLKQNGYVTSYLGGASLRFGGKGNFYKTHQFDTVQGLEHHKRVLPFETTALSEWGLYDEDLYPLAWKEFTRLTTQHKPFAFFLLTLDTHPPSGLPSSSCDGIRYGDGKNAMLNTLHCSDQLAANFIRQLLASEAAAETIIVVASDHLVMANDAGQQLKQHPNRRNLFFILETNGRQESLDRHASPFDIAPTLLSVLGAETEGYNLGVSLLGDNKTIMERIEDPDTALRRWSGKHGEMLY
jgi:phosphoglycerol transferase